VPGGKCYGAAGKMGWWRGIRGRVTVGQPGVASRYLGAGLLPARGYFRRGWHGGRDQRLLASAHRLMDANGSSPFSDSSSPAVML
jgi:hypothetical protein